MEAKASIRNRCRSLVLAASLAHGFPSPMLRPCSTVTQPLFVVLDITTVARAANLSCQNAGKAQKFTRNRDSKVIMKRD